MLKEYKIYVIWAWCNNYMRSRMQPPRCESYRELWDKLNK